MASFYACIISYVCVLTRWFTLAATQNGDGNWGGWSQWTACSATCGGGGYRMRARVCNLADTYGTQVCTRPGFATPERKECGLPSCVAPRLSSVIPLGCWQVPPTSPKQQQLDQNPSSCINYCVNGLNMKYAAIDLSVMSFWPYSQGTCYCLDDYQQIGRSNLCDSVCKDSGSGVTFFGYLCGYSGGGGHASVYASRQQGPSVDEWSEWSSCNCAGKRTRSRNCYGGEMDGTMCLVPLKDTGNCWLSTKVGNWTEWTSWSPCSVTCGGGGVMSRSRVCQPPCNGEVEQLCEIAGEVETDEKSCGLAKCLTADNSFGYEDKLMPVSQPLGCVTNPSGSHHDGSPYLTPSQCAYLCESEPDNSTYGIISEQPGRAFCFCSQDEIQPVSMVNTICTQVCYNGNFPPYLCGSGNLVYGSLYATHRDYPFFTEWSAWSPCVCPRGRFRRKRCISGKIFSGCEEAQMTEYEGCDSCVNCTELSNPMNGVIGGDLINGFGTVRRFSCNAGFRLVGDAALMCTSNGTWNGTIPDCIALPGLCQMIHPFEHQNIHWVAGFGGANNSLEFTCDDGYTLVGEAVLECLCESCWNASQPKCQAQPNIIFISNPNLSRNFSITATFAASQPVRAFWLPPGSFEPLEESSGPYEIQKPAPTGQTSAIGVPIMQSMLAIVDITNAALGTFVFVAENQAGMATRPVFINTNDAIQLVEPKQQLNKISTTLHSTMSFTCKFLSTACPNVLWWTPNSTNPIEETTGPFIITSGNCSREQNFNLTVFESTLILREVTNKTEGTYACFGLNQMLDITNASARFQLKIMANGSNAIQIVEPKQQLSRVTANVASTVNFTCKFASTVCSNVLWWTPNSTNPIEETTGPFNVISGNCTEESIGNLVTFESTLAITDVTEAMGGTFACFGFNQALDITNASARFQLNVLNAIWLLEPQQQLNKISSDIGLPVNFTCRFASAICSTVLWWTPNSMVPIEETTGRFKVISEKCTEEQNGKFTTFESTLSITEVTEKMEGTFACFGFNRVADVQNTSARFQLMIPTGGSNVIQLVEPKEQFIKISTSLHSSLNFTCKFLSTHCARVLWWTPNSSIPLRETTSLFIIISGKCTDDDHDTLTTIKSTLVIPEVTANMEGTFACFGFSQVVDIANASARFQLKIPTTPSNGSSSWYGSPIADAVSGICGIVLGMFIALLFLRRKRVSCSHSSSHLILREQDVDFDPRRMDASGNIQED